jgi:serine/threonine protein phosphatase PrpC
MNPTPKTLLILNSDGLFNVYEARDVRLGVTSLSDAVQAAHDAASDGDTIVLPTTGFSEWRHTVHLSKAVNLRGK